MASKVIRVADLPGMRAFFDAVTALLNAINAEPGVPAAVQEAATAVRAETLGIGEGPAVTLEEDEKSPGRLQNEENLRTAMIVAKENPSQAINVDWVPE